MIKRYTYGKPIETDAILIDVDEGTNLDLLDVKESDTSITFSCPLSKEDKIYGLGETVGGQDKRGGRYVSFNTDQSFHLKNTPSLYSSHNFLVVDSSSPFGVFVDTPSRVIFYIDYKKSGKLEIFSEKKDLKLYIIKCEDPYSITKEFLKAIGRSYIPPLWAFGYGQSRWGYKDEKDILQVAAGYQKTDISLDYICLDIDYMDNYKDFTINKERFPDFKRLVSYLKDDGIRLVPIVDAAIKKEDGYSIYDEGRQNKYFCTEKDGTTFIGDVWPGNSCFPDFSNPEAREWFGNNYSFYTSQGIEGFWNDMNEPSIFKTSYSKGKKKKDEDPLNLFKGNSHYSDYTRFYQDVEGEKINHIDIHNIYGYQMTKAASMALDKIIDKRFMLFVRSSYIGGHRYGGIWTGDNLSYFGHLNLLMHQLPNLNMCGFLFSGSDTGGFMGVCDKELMIRWLEVSVFTPLLRNHSASMSNKKRELYKFKDKRPFKNAIDFRYKILPYIYSEYVKAALNSDMYIKPLSFIFKDKESRDIEDQLLVGDCIMIAPILKRGRRSRNVYLPEDMTFVIYKDDTFIQQEMKQGHHKIHIALDEVSFFIRKDKAIIISKGGKNTSEVDLKDVKLLGSGNSYLQYLDDGFTKDVKIENIRTVTREN